MKRVELEQRAARAVKEQTVIRMAFPTAAVREIEVDDASQRKPIEAVINTNDIDHYNSIVDPMGADFGDYNANPIVLYAHGTDMQVGDWPVGRCLKLTRTDTEIVAELEFDLDGKLHGDANKKLGAELDRLYREKWIRGFSVGFIPTDYEWRMVDEVEYLVYTGWKLVEFSAVAIPGNPRALARALASETLRIESQQLRQDIDAATSELPPEHDANAAANSDAGSSAENGGVDAPRTTPAEQAGKADDSHEQNGKAELQAEIEQLQADNAALKQRLAELEKPAAAAKVDWNGEWKLAAECRAASPAALRGMAAVMDGDDAWLIHHRADGTLAWRGLAYAMGTLLTQPLDLTSEQKEAAYEHLAAHYRELGIEPPEGGMKQADQAYDLALEGRIALIDEADYVWLYRECVEQSGVKVPVFERVDDADATHYGHVPTIGRLMDSRQWGKRSLGTPSASEEVLRELATTQKRLADLMDSRAGAEFSSKNKSRITNAANDAEQAAATLEQAATQMRNLGAYLRSMIEQNADEETKDAGGAAVRDSDPGSESATAKKPRTGFQRPL